MKTVAQTIADMVEKFLGRPPGTGFPPERAPAVLEEMARVGFLSKTVRKDDTLFAPTSAGLHWLTAPAAALA